MVRFKLRAENCNGGFMGCWGDKSGLNAVVLKCKNGETVSSSQQKWGDWTGWSNKCAGGFSGAQVLMALDAGVSVNTLVIIFVVIEE